MKITTNQNIVTINIQKIMPNLTKGSLFYIDVAGASRENPGRSEQVTGNINSSIRGKFKRDPRPLEKNGRYAKFRCMS